MAKLPRPHLIAFIDESGDFELKKIDPKFPVCAQCALTSTVDQYLASAVPNLLQVKYSFWGTETIVFHGQKIRKRSPPFHILADDDVRAEFMDAIGWAIENLDGCLVTAAVHKERLKGRYIYPEDPFFLSLQFLLERLHMHWEGELLKGHRLLCVFEKRGRNEDRRTLDWFEEICGGRNYRGKRFPFDADFRTKEENVSGHQYADLVAYAACRFVETGDESRRDWRAIKGKLRSVGGEVVGHGLKMFP
ncbi:MAG: DUF3800 domain-containing protein [Phenylobacterium sp.]|uniref:DUF3800 domain-containing protein n=1 Tax=Phenylobacterium sp. TaxID=1871053 RepID=UPI00391CD5B7